MIGGGPERLSATEIEEPRRARALLEGGGGPRLRGRPEAYESLGTHPGAGAPM
jgi:hypothetical protein